jgi:modulator of FtsH protease
MYQQPQPYNFGGRPRAAAVSTAGLLGQVLGLTGVAFLITAATAYFVPNPPFGFSMGAMIAGFILIFAINGTRANAQLSLLLFYAFASLQGIWIAPVISHYIAALGSEVIFEAAATTGLGMLVIGGVAWVSSFDFRKLSLIAFAMLIGLVLIGIISIFVNFLHPGTYAWATLAVFTLLMLIDFQRIRAGGDGATPVQLALAIYLDGINFFMAILRLLGLRGRD